MTYKDLIDTLVRKSGDTSADFKANAYRWLNITRAEAAARGNFQTAKVIRSGFTTVAGTATYQISPDRAVFGDEMVNVTNTDVICRTTSQEISRLDPDRNEAGPPELWADAGLHLTGDLLVQFWPIPDAEYVIQFDAEAKLVDVTAASDAVTRDAYFGNIIQVSPMLLAGLYWQYAIFDDQDAGEIARAEAAFARAVARHSGRSGPDSRAGSRLEPVLRQGSRPGTGRFSSHFDNR